MSGAAENRSARVSRKAFDKSTLLIARLAGVDARVYRKGKQARLPSGVLGRGVVTFESENCYVSDVLGEEVQEALHDPLFANVCRDAARGFLRIKHDLLGVEDDDRTELRDLRRWHMAQFAIRMFRAGYLTAREQTTDPHHG